MRDFSKVACRVWRSQKFKKLDDQDKLLYLYILTNVHSNSAGCYILPTGYATVDLKWSEERFIKGIESLCDALLITFDKDEEMVRIVGWFPINPPVNPNHAKKVFDDIAALPDGKQRANCLLELEDCLLNKGWNIPMPMQILLEGYRKASERVSPPDQTRPDRDKDQTERRRDFEKAIELFNEMAARIGIPSVQKLSETRKKHLGARLKDIDGIDGWKIALEKLEASSFCKGNNDRGWKADFDFLIRESSFIKLMEGKYDDNAKQHQPGSTEYNRQQFKEWAEEPVDD